MHASALSNSEGDRGVTVLVAGLGHQDVLFGRSAWKSYRAETHATLPLCGSLVNLQSWSNLTQW